MFSVRLISRQDYRVTCSSGSLRNTPTDLRCEAFPALPIFPTNPNRPTMNHPTKLPTALKNAGLCFLSALGCFLFVLFALEVNPRAQSQTSTCTPTPAPTPIQICTLHENTPCATPPCSPIPYPSISPFATAIPDEFQPRDAAGNRLSTVLEWRVYEPTPVPSSGKGPAVLLLHEGHFVTGNIFSGLLADPILDLREAGYYVFVAAHRLAPCGLVTGQDCHNLATSGRPPEQTNDVKAFTRAMKADSRCDNGKFGIVGGSSGASHAAFAAFDITSTSDWPYWNRDGDDRPLAVACLSGAYDFTDRTTDDGYPNIPGDPVNDFRNKIENYTGTCVRFDPNGGPNQWSSSPVAHLQTFTTAKPFRPMYFIHSRFDSMPYHQLFDVQCKLTGVGVNSSQYQVLTIQNSHEHAFQYWRSGDGTGSAITNGTRVINFLNSHLK